MQDPLLSDDQDLYEMASKDPHVGWDASDAGASGSYGAGAPSKARRFVVHYAWIFWGLYFAITIYFIVDRFTGNRLFPAGILDFAALPSDTAFTVQLFDVYNRATGRLFVSTTMFLLWTQCKTLENVIMLNRPKWLEIGDIRTWHNAAHYQLGLFGLGIPMVIHLFTIFLPVIFGGKTLLFDQEPEGVPLTPFVSADGNIFFLGEDFVRLTLAFPIFFFLLPLSVSNWGRRLNFSVAHWLHLLGALIYFCDFMRGVHPHAQFYCGLMVSLYAIDRFIGLFFYRTGEARVIHRERLDHEYEVVFLYVPNQARKRPIGSAYYLKVPRSPWYEFSHPFACFQNHGDTPMLKAWLDRDRSSDRHKFFVADEAGDDSESEDSRASRFSRRGTVSKSITHEQDDTRVSGVPTHEGDDHYFFANWNAAAIVRLHYENRGTRSFSSSVCQLNVGGPVRYWGPYMSEYGLLDEAVQAGPMVLLASGAGAAFILDFYLSMVSRNMRLMYPVSVYMTTNSVGLFQFFTDLTCDHPIENWSVSAHLTRHEHEFDVDEDKVSRSSDRDGDRSSSKRGMALGRLSFAQVLQAAPTDSTVFFCGSPLLQWHLEVECARLGLTYYPGHRFSSQGLREVKRTGKYACRMRCTEFPCCCSY